MDSSQILNSTNESEQEFSQTEEILSDSLCSTDDDELLAKENQPQELKRANEFVDSEQCGCGVAFKQMPRSIFDFLKIRKVPLQKSQRSKAKAAPLIKSVRFDVKGFEMLSAEEGEQSQESFVVYDIEATEEFTREGESVPEQKQCWSFSSRYSMLRELFESLKKELSKEGKDSLPSFPGRKIFGNTKPSFLNKRLADLSQFFSIISKSSNVMNSKTMAEFIDESRNEADTEFSL